MVQNREDNTTRTKALLLKPKRLFCLAVIVGFIYGSISYLGMWIYFFIPGLGYILSIPSRLAYYSASVLNIPISRDLGQYWIFSDWLVVVLFTIMYSILVAYIFSLIKRSWKL